jgi:carboxyl-terminal processing protease
MGTKKLQVWLPLLFSIVMVLGMIIGYEIRGNSKNKGFFYSGKSSSLQEMLELVKDKYVDAVNVDSLTEITASSFLSHLDPHSVFIPASDFRDVNDELMGNFQGIGVEFQIFDDTVNVVRVMKGGPSEKAGIEIGDKLIKCNDSVQLAGKKLKSDDIRKQLRGPAGSSVKVNILRNGTLKDFVIQRGNINVPSVDASYIIAPQTGYIRINKFAERTYEEFMQNLEKLQKEGMQKLILDLRGNGGGLLSEATAIADEFLDGDKLIVYTQGNKSPRAEYHCKKDGLFEKGKLVVLVDETSASASEVLTGALQDWDRATVIGRRSFGKGLVQQQFQLSDGSALRLTVARYYTPLGRNIQKPYDKGKEKYDEELLNRYHDGELLKADSAKQKGPSFKTPKGHVVYGGGGIMPDIFVSADTSKLHIDIAKMFYKNTLGNFVYKYYLQHVGELKNVKNIGEISSSINQQNNLIDQLEQFAAKDSVHLNNIIDKEKDEILERMTALLARQILGTDAYIEVLNQADKTVQKALLELK